VHTGVELHPDGNRLSQISGFQRFELLRVMDRRMQMLRGNIGRSEASKILPAAGWAA
jgi:hypothetical protein